MTKTNSRDVEEPQQVPVTSAGVEGKEEKKQETHGKVTEISLLIFSHSCCYYPPSPRLTTCCFFMALKYLYFRILTTRGQQIPGQINRRRKR